MRNPSRMKTARDSGFVLLLVFFLTASCAWAQSEDELIRGAKKEGKVVFWSSMRIDDSKALAAGFEARYPFIKVDIFRAGGEQIVNRAMAEHLAGRTTYDVVNAFESRHQLRSRLGREQRSVERHELVERKVQAARDMAGAKPWAGLGLGPGEAAGGAHVHHLLGTSGEVGAQGGQVAHSRAVEPSGEAAARQGHGPRRRARPRAGDRRSERSTTRAER